MKTFEAVFNEDTKGVFGISLVRQPAMEGDFIALSKDKELIQLKTLDEEKRILVGLVLEPNKYIPRFDEKTGEWFQLTMSPKTVEELCYAFSKNKYNSNSTIEHDGNKKIEGVTFVENWLVRDEKIDTSIALGLECKKDSWVSVMKVDSDEVWIEYVKTGKVKGFSIDAMLELKEVNYKPEIEMNKKEFFTELKKIFSFTEDTEEVKDVEVKDVVEVQPETPAEEVVEEKAEVEVNVLQEVVDALAQFSKDQDAKLEAVKTEFSKQLEDKEKEVVELKAEVVELGKQPASKPVVSTPVVLTKQGRILQELRNNK